VNYLLASNQNYDGANLFVASDDNPWWSELLSRGHSALLHYSRDPNARYFNDELTDVNFVLRFEPMPLTAARMTIEIPAAISPYSIAVAPRSSATNFAKICFTSNLRRLMKFTSEGWIQMHKAG
jgi:hypothetical protein